MATMITDMIKDAIAVTYDHLKFARKMLRAAEGDLLISTMTKEATTAMADDKNLEQLPQLQNTQAFGIITGVWISFALLVILIAVALFLWLRRQIGHWEINQETMRTWLQQLLNLIKLHQINEEKVRKEIKASIEDFRSMKERLKLMKLQKINKNDVKDIKAAITTVRSIEEHLKLMKSQKFNEEDEKEMKSALKPAIDAVQAMEKIINNGVWLLGHL
jgi:hypothetical protein